MNPAGNGVSCSPAKNCFNGALKKLVFSPSIFEQDDEESGWIMVQRHWHSTPGIAGGGGMSSCSPASKQSIMPRKIGSMDPHSKLMDPDQVPLDCSGSNSAADFEAHTGQLGLAGVTRQTRTP